MATVYSSDYDYPIYYGGYNINYDNYEQLYDYDYDFDNEDEYCGDRGFYED